MAKHHNISPEQKIRVEGGRATNLNMTEVCVTISRIMMEVVRATSDECIKLLNVIQVKISCNFFICGNRYETVYFMMR